nr:MAG TPA: hypothetical protein [Caudoviricetes sp.]
MVRFHAGELALPWRTYSSTGRKPLCPPPPIPTP